MAGTQGFEPRYADPLNQINGLAQANQGEVGQNPQHGRNKPPEYRDALIEAPLASPPHDLACFDSEEDTRHNDTHF